MAKVSVILPVYNSAETLETCMNAVLRQSFSDFELLVLDDGSEDQSVEIGNRYAQMDKRVKVFPLAHGGVSAARNAGLRYAKGKYIAFVDSDDVPDEDWLSSLFGQVVAGGLSVCGYTVTDEKGKTLYTTEDSLETRRERKIEVLQFTEDIFSNRLLYQGYVWNKLFDRELIVRGTPLQFREGICFNEDRLFLFWYLQRCRTVWYDGTSRYQYRASRKPRAFLPEQLTELDAFEEMCAELERKGDKCALFYAQKDCLRAAVELYELAGKDGERQETARLEKKIFRYRDYEEEYPEYPLSFQRKVRKAVKEATGESQT